MISALRRSGLLLGLLATVLLAACGANGEGAPAASGCPVGAAASTCTSGSESTSAGSSSTGTCTQSPQPGPNDDNFCRLVGISTDQPDGLQYGDITVGTGPVVKTGDKVTMQYTGWLQSTGVRFDTSRQAGRGPFPLTLGQHQVIQGWEEGIPGMRVGGKRRLIIPPALGYGAQGYPPTIPANSTLVFDVEVVSIG